MVWPEDPAGEAEEDTTGTTKLTSPRWIVFCASGRHVFASLSFFHLKSPQGFEYFELNILGFGLYKPLKGCLGYKMALLSSSELTFSFRYH